MPDAVAVDDAVTLNCDFDLEGVSAPTQTFIIQSNLRFSFVQKRTHSTRCDGTLRLKSSIDTCPRSHRPR